LLDYYVHPWSEPKVREVLAPHFADVRKTTLLLVPGSNMLMHGFYRPQPDGESQFMGDGAPFSPGIRP
jgi:hypothetical protein